MIKFRSLGTISLDKSYLGYDISGEIVPIQFGYDFSWVRFLQQSKLLSYYKPFKECRTLSNQGFFPVLFLLLHVSLFRNLAHCYIKLDMRQ